MNKQKALELVKKHGGINEAARVTHTSKKTIADAIGCALPERKNASRTSVSIPMKTKSIAEFRAAYDKSYIIPRKVKAGLKQLGSGWEYESDFAKSIMVKLSDLSSFRDMFADHIVQLNEGRRAWAGKKSTADAMREML